MYPTVVIVLVEKQRSMTDICEVSSSNASNSACPIASEARAATLGHLSFAVGSTCSTMDSESESRSPRVSQSQDRLLEKVILEIRSQTGSSG